MKEDIIILHICAKFRVQAIFRSRDIGSNEGQNGSKIGFSWFSQKLESRFSSSLSEEDIIILQMCTKFQVQTSFCFRDIGSNGGQNGSMVFLEFSQKLGDRFGSIS